MVALNIVLVATSTTVGSLTAQEQALRTVLMSTLGNTVELRLHTDPLPSSGDFAAMFSGAGADLVVVSPDAQQNQIIPKYDSCSIGVLSFDARKFPHSGVSVQGWATGGNIRRGFYFYDDSSDVSSPLYTGGETDVYSSDPSDIFYYVEGGSNFPSGAIKWMSRDATTTATVNPGFGIDIGGTLADGVSTLTGHRIGIVGITKPAEVTSPSIQAYMQRAMEWVANVGSGGGPVTPTVLVDETRTVTLDASGSTGTAPLTYGFSQVSGPAVTLTGTGAVRTFEEPASWTEDIVIAVTVTGDDDGETTQHITVSAPEGGSGEPTGPHQYLMYDPIAGWS